MTLNSMTGFAAVSGQAGTLEWQWEARSVNARGLDLRVRLPEGLEALEAKLRKTAQACLARGAVQVTLRLTHTEETATGALVPAALARAVEMMKAVEHEAQAAGLHLAPARAADLLSLRGVVEYGRNNDSVNTAAEPAAAALDELFRALAEARAREGAALHSVLSGQIDRMAALLAQAVEAVETRSGSQANSLRDRVAALLEAQDRVEEARLAQELALLAVKGDVREELDRLGAHIDSARTLLDSDGPAGRKLDFLMQEFNREANTLCSKSQDAALTAIGLEMKVVIDQMREQCQNVE